MGGWSPPSWRNTCHDEASKLLLVSPVLQYFWPHLISKYAMCSCPHHHPEDESPGQWGSLSSQLVACSIKSDSLFSKFHLKQNQERPFANLGHALNGRGRKYDHEYKVQAKLAKKA